MTRCVICGVSRWLTFGQGEFWQIRPISIGKDRVGLCKLPECQHAALLKLIALQRRPARMAGRRSR